MSDETISLKKIIACLRVKRDDSAQFKKDYITRNSDYLALKVNNKEFKLNQCAKISEKVSESGAVSESGIVFCGDYFQEFVQGDLVPIVNIFAHFMHQGGIPFIALNALNEAASSILSENDRFINLVESETNITTGTQSITVEQSVCFNINRQDPKYIIFFVCEIPIDQFNDHIEIDDRWIKIFEIKISPSKSELDLLTQDINCLNKSLLMGNLYQDLSACIEKLKKVVEEHTLDIRYNTLLINFIQLIWLSSKKRDINVSNIKSRVFSCFFNLDVSGKTWVDNLFTNVDAKIIEKFLFLVPTLSQDELIKTFERYHQLKELNLSFIPDKIFELLPRDSITEEEKNGILIEFVNRRLEDPGLRGLKNMMINKIKNGYFNQSSENLLKQLSRFFSKPRIEIEIENKLTELSCFLKEFEIPPPEQEVKRSCTLTP